MYANGFWGLIKLIIKDSMEMNGVLKNTRRLNIFFAEPKKFHDRRRAPVGIPFVSFLLPSGGRCQVP